MFFELLLGSFEGYSHFLWNLVPFIFFYLVAGLMEVVIDKTKNILALRRVLYWVFSLVIFDQIVKTMIKNLVLPGKKIPIVMNWLYLTNELNYRGSFITSRFNINIPIIVLIILNIFILFFMVQGYRFYILKKKRSKWLDVTIILFIAGGISSLIDKIFFGGSLDFIGLRGLFAADLKDFYLTIGVGCLLSELVENPEADDILKDDGWTISEFIKFSFKWIKSLH